MSENEREPLLAAGNKGKNPANSTNFSGETTPLLSGSASTGHYDGDDDTRSIRSHHSEASSARSAKKRSRRWPSVIAMALLATVGIAILILAFVVPDAVEEYAKEAAVVEPTNLSLESITANGVRARIQANFRLDGSRVKNDHVRRVGKATTWVANQLGTEETEVVVYLPEYDNILLGTAKIPSLVVNLRDGVTTQVDFVTDIAPGDVEGIRAIANEWLEGRLNQLRLRGKADLPIRSGIIPLGTHTVSESLLFEAKKIPAVPKYTIERLNIKDVEAPGDKKVMVAEVSLSAFNQYPIEVTVPELAFEILVPNCNILDPYIVVADAVTSEINVLPNTKVFADVHGIIRELPESLTRACPNSNSSPLDLLLDQYMHGEPATIFVRGSSTPDGNTPQWIADILASVTLPIPFPGRTFDSLIRNFSLTDVHFTLPNPMAEEGDPDADPKVSGTIEVIAGVPSEVNFEIDVTKVKATADVCYKKKKMGELNLKKWHKANSTRHEATKKEEATLQIQSRIDDAPLNITDADVFSDVLQTLLFGGKRVMLDIKAAVDVKVETALGEMVLKGVPAEGKVPVKPFPKSSFKSLAPTAKDIKILETGANSLTLEALVNMTNPTSYTAYVPYINIHLLSNGTILGEASAENINVMKGENSNIKVKARWNPQVSGLDGQKVGRDLISQYISGMNTTITVKAHPDSIPGQKLLCDALSRFNITVDAPRLRLPGSEGQDRAHFIQDATFHILSSTATFTLVSPLHYNTIYLDKVNATAFYNHTEPVGVILYNLPFAAPPGRSQTPKLPVDWSVNSVGYEAVKNALGGRLKLDAQAIVGIRIGNWEEELWYNGQGIGASVRL